MTDKSNVIPFPNRKVKRIKPITLEKSRARLKANIEAEDKAFFEKMDELFSKVKTP